MAKTDDRNGGQRRITKTDDKTDDRWRNVETDDIGMANLRLRAATHGEHQAADQGGNNCSRPLVTFRKNTLFWPAS